MNKSERWFVEQSEYNSIVRTQPKEDDENFVADCGAGDDGAAFAKRIVADHIGCLGIEDPETTVPELVDVCNRMYVSLTNAVALLDELPLTSKLLDDVRAVLAKTGEKTGEPE